MSSFCKIWYVTQKFYMPFLGNAFGFPKKSFFDFNADPSKIVIYYILVFFLMKTCSQFSWNWFHEKIYSTNLPYALALLGDDHDVTWKLWYFWMICYMHDKWARPNRTGIRLRWISMMANQIQTTWTELDWTTESCDSQLLQWPVRRTTLWEE